MNNKIIVSFSKCWEEINRALSQREIKVGHPSARRSEKVSMSKSHWHRNLREKKESATRRTEERGNSRGKGSKARRLWAGGDSSALGKRKCGPGKVERAVSPYAWLGTPWDPRFHYKYNGKPDKSFKQVKGIILIMLKNHFWLLCGK